MKSIYTLEQRNAYIEAWKKENKETGITQSEFAKREGLLKNTFNKWIERANNSDVSLTKIVRREKPSITVNYHGAEIKTLSQSSLVELLKAIRLASL